MKHKRIKTYLKFGILLFGICTIGIACQKDDAVSKNEQNIDAITPTITTLSYETADAKFNQLKDQVKITKYLQVPEGSSLQGKSTKDTLGLTIATDIIKQVTFGDYTSYTMKIIYESDGTVFYNLTIEDKNGVPNVFITQYIPNDYWLNNKDEPFQGSIQSKNGDKLTVFNPDEGADEDNGGYENDNNLGIGAGVGGTTGSYSANYPTDCFGTVIITTAWEAYQCTCNPGHWPGEYCTCHESGGELPGYNQVILYGCEENWDNDLDDPNDTTDPGGISETDPINDVSIGVLVKEDEECLPEDARPYDYDNSCSLDVYESCRMNGNNHEICECVSNGGNLEDCQEQEEQINHCNKLKKLVETDSLGSNILPYVNQLRARINLDKEWYLNYSNEWVGSETRPVPDIDGVQEGISKTRSKLRYSDLWVGQIHTHPKKTFEVFSWLDLKSIKLLYENTNDYFKEDIFIMAVAPNNETYALKIDDFQALSEKINNDLTNTEGSTNTEKGDNLMKAMKKEYNKSDNLEQTFLELYGNYGIAFYKATDANLTNWKQLELDENDDEIVNETPCN